MPGARSHPRKRPGRCCGASVDADVEGARAMLADALSNLERRAWRARARGVGTVLSGARRDFRRPGGRGTGGSRRARNLHGELGVKVGEGRAIRGRPRRAGARLSPGEQGNSWWRGLGDPVGHRRSLVAGPVPHLYLGMIAEETGAGPSETTAHYRQAVDLLRPYGSGPLLPIALALKGGSSDVATPSAGSGSSPPRRPSGREQAGEFARSSGSGSIG